MAFLEEIKVQLSTNSVASSSGEGGWFIALGQMPDSTVTVDRIVALLQTQGFAPDAATEIDRPALQVLTRGLPLMENSTAYEEAEAKAQEVKRTLHAITPGSLSGRHYVGIWAEQDPFFAGYDEKDRPHFSQNFRVERSRT